MFFSKGRGMAIAAGFILLAVYNVVIFVIPFHGGGTFWTAYAFSMVALLLTIAVNFYALDRQSLKSKFYGVPLLFVVWRYLAIQLSVGLLGMILHSIPFQYGLAVYTILLGACLLGLIVVEAGTDMVEEVDHKIEKKTKFIKTLHAFMLDLTDRAKEENIYIMQR